VSAAAGELMARSRVARLATLDESGYPHLVPVCYATDGRAYYSALDAKPKRVPPSRLRRVRNIRANPRVALLFDHYEEDWRRLSYVMVQGQAEVLTAGPEWQAARALLTAKYPQYTALPLPPDGLMLKITPERISSWSAA
jgi:PPOX class probable F420-dependent enzyme